MSLPAGISRAGTTLWRTKSSQLCSASSAARYHHRSMGTIRVALAEDNVLLREGVSRLVAANEDFDLVGTASDLPELLAMVGEQLPDVVITDIRMPPGCGKNTLRSAWLC